MTVEAKGITAAARVLPRRVGGAPRHLLDHGRPARLADPTVENWGRMRLRTVGHRTGKERIAILGYLEDGSNLATTAMNGWADPEPAWWLNLQAHPDAWVDLVDESRPVRGRAATADERSRLWARWAVYDRNLDAYAARRSRPTQVVILEPRSV